MASKVKRKTEILAVKYPNGAVVAETEYDRNLLKNLPVGCAVKIMPMSNNRNYQHHKKFFALLDTGFEYWQPKFQVMSEMEVWICDEVYKGVSKIMPTDTLRTWLREFLDSLAERITKHRREKLDYEGMKTLEAYLNHVMKQAGFYDIKPSADGGTFKERWSISFNNCPQEKFNEIYKGVFGVIWNETLCNVYQDKWKLENKISQLSGF